MKMILNAQPPIFCTRHLLGVVCTVFNANDAVPEALDESKEAARAAAGVAVRKGQPALSSIVFATN